MFILKVDDESCHKSWRHKHFDMCSIYIQEYLGLFQKCDVATCSRQASTRFSCLDKCTYALKVIAESCHKSCSHESVCQSIHVQFMQISHKILHKMKAAKNPYLKECGETTEFTATM